MKINRLTSILLFISMLPITWTIEALPGDILFSDNFERASLAPWTSTNTTMSNISTHTSNSGTRSLFTRHGTVTATSPVTNLSGIVDAKIEIWVRRGSDSFSEDPDTNEDIFIEYLDNSSSWITIYNGAGNGGSNGEVISVDQALPSSALHSGFRIRVRQTRGSGSDYDYWHVDDIVVTDTGSVPPTISISKTSDVISDGVNATNPKRIPGALVEYDITAVNSGPGPVDNNSILITDAIPANTALFVNDISGSGTGPVRFVDGSPPSGLTYTFTNLSNTTDDISFSNNGGASYTYTPTAAANGTDSNITHIRITPKSQFLAPSGSGNPSFTLKFRVLVD